MAGALTLYADSSFLCPWVFHAMVALEEKQLAYKLETVALPTPPPIVARLAEKALFGTVPILVHDAMWITESLAISEYLAERFPIPDHPRIFPADLGERARARQLMLWLRSNLAGLYADRPTTNIFGRPTVRPLSTTGRADADELLRVASVLIEPGQTQLFGDWSIADADIALALMRMIGSQDSVPRPLVDYALAQWDRRSIRRFCAHVPTTP